MSTVISDIFNGKEKRNTVLETNLNHSTTPATKISFHNRLEGFVLVVCLWARYYTDE